MKYRKRFNRSIFWAMIFMAGMVSTVAFQNCSQIEFESTPALINRLVCDDEGNCVLKGEAIVTAGVDLPPLKMVFVVDNSYTMKANQLNLAGSFDQMFAPGNSSNLVPFDTTAYLFNTAQYSYNLTNPGLTLLSNHLLPIADALALPKLDVTTKHRPVATGGLLSGQIPGDVVGYKLKAQDGRYDWLPAAVMNYTSETNNLILSEAMRKPANRDASSLLADFQARLKLLNPDYNPDNGDGRFFAETQDNESAMCAMARVLRNPESYLKSSDQSVFIFVTDENEADLSGSRCIQSTFKTNEDVVTVFCEEHHPTLELSKSNCSGRYVTGYKVAYDYITQEAYAVTYTNGINGVKYKPVVSVTYPRTKITFDEQGYLANDYSISYNKRRYSSQSTKIDYFVKTCEIRDGVPTNQCTWTPNSGTLLGDRRGDCSAAATEVSGKTADIITAGYLPKCTFNATFAELERGKSCDTTLSTCKVAYPAETDATKKFTSRGFFTTVATCNAETKRLLTEAKRTDSYDAYVEDGVSDATCTKTGQTRVVGTCPVVTGCTVSNLLITHDLVPGDYYSDATKAKCRDKAIALNANAIVSTANCAAVKPDFTDENTKSCSGIPDCKENLSSTFVTDNTKFSCDGLNSCTYTYGPRLDTAKTSCTGVDASWGCQVLLRDKAITGTELTVNFASGNLPGPLLAANSNCTTDIKALVKASQSKYESTNACKVKEIIYSAYQPLTVAKGSTCQAAALNLCDTTNDTGTKRFCEGNDAPVLKTFTFNEDLDCNTKCGDSVAKACGSFAGSTSDMKVSEALGLATGLGTSGYSCRISANTVTPIKNGTTVLASEKDSVCKVKSNVATYIDTARTKAPFKSNLPISDFVSGSTRANDGSFSPAKNLKDYIIERSKELFGSGFQPIASVFVRQSADGNGTGGSVGTDYIDLANKLSGQSTSVINGDYGGPLRDLSRIIKERVQRSFVLAQLQPGQEVRRVWLWNKLEGRWVELLSTQFIAFSNTITIAPGVPFEQGDRFRIEYW